ncbi:MAG TPA: tRNA (adenosine(37)-N6)-threonylcarbamoyltransferase complex dimerization subunit type 1 TsaB [Candidatus Saccharimonadales bacterium]|nr:tRNA (adenosine(37)-N6)-threonylcarbamoyltransferase complex dimerization subunit type 1 TsaB [Candidatus Saccharimonadales bacterium]
MLILTIRTDKPEAEIGLFENSERLAYEQWQAHRALAETIHTKIEDLLKNQGKDWQAIEGIVCFEGPGSFTGLRIGLSVGNALAYSLNVPIIAERGESWLAQGITQLEDGKSDKLVLPHYGSPPHITYSN